MSVWSIILIVSCSSYAVYAIVLRGVSRRKDGTSQDVLESIVIKRRGSQALLDRQKELEKFYYIHRAHSRKLH